MSQTWKARGRPCSKLVASHSRLVALRTAWLAHILRQATTAVARSDEQTYRDFGLDREEILRALRLVHDGLEDAVPATQMRRVSGDYG
jgi:hypothetical protein